MPHRTLVIGIPRSGSTWIARTLAQAPRTSYVHEPDNEKRDPFALKVKRRLGRFPAIDAANADRGYTKLWDGAFAGGIFSTSGLERTSLGLMGGVSKDDLERAVAAEGRSRRVRATAALARPRVFDPRADRVVVKSVHAALSLGWLRERWSPGVVVVMRHPLNVIASMLELDMPDRDRRLDHNGTILERFVRPWAVPLPASSATPLQRVAWQVGLLSSALEHASAPGDVVVIHEDVCVDPVERFRTLFKRVGLEWRDEVAEHLRESDRPGTGFKPRRVAADQPERWRKRLTPPEVDEIREVLRSFPTRRWPNDGSSP